MTGLCTHLYSSMKNFTYVLLNQILLYYKWMISSRLSLLSVFDLLLFCSFVFVLLFTWNNFDESETTSCFVTSAERPELYLIVLRYLTDLPSTSLTDWVDNYTAIKVKLTSVFPIVLEGGTTASSTYSCRLCTVESVSSQILGEKVTDGCHDWNTVCMSHRRVIAFNAFSALDSNSFQLW